MTLPSENERVQRVLIVEDEPRLRDMLLRAIPDMGFHATGARSGEEALKLMEADPAPVAILDLNLPGMNGLALCEQIRQRWADTQVIILTGFGDLEAAQQAIRMGVVDFLTKPCTLGDLEVAIDRAWRRRTQDAKAAVVAAAAEVMPPEPELPPASPDDKPPTTLQDLERIHILAALRRNNGNRTATAAELGISLRTLYYRLAEYQKQGFQT